MSPPDVLSTTLLNTGLWGSYTGHPNEVYVRLQEGRVEISHDVFVASSNEKLLTSTDVSGIVAGVGLSASGTFVADPSGNYTWNATSFMNADHLLDAQLKVVTDQIADVQGEVNHVESGAGLTASGTYVADPSSNYLSAATSLFNADQLLDSQIASIVLSQTDIQTEVNTIETGAGLSASGNYVVDPSSNYLSSATSLFNADHLLDGALRSVQVELDSVESGAGLTASGTYVADPSSNYLSAATSLFNADQLLDAQIASIVLSQTDIQTEVNTIETGAGLSASGTYVFDASSNYLLPANSLKQADHLLDAQLKIVADDLASAAVNAIGNTLVRRDNLGSANFYNVNIGGDAIVTGNLTVNGTTTTVNSTNTNITDAFIHIADNNNTDAVYSGIFSEYATVSGSALSSGLVRDFNTSHWKLFKDSSLSGVETPSDFSVLADLEVNSVISLSDKSLKDNIVEIDNALLKVNQLRGVYYNWIDPRFGKQRNAGVIAQEVNDVLPEIVDKNSQSGLLMVDYSRLTSLLIQAVKELDAKIEKCKCGC
jgi:hypothetical protein